jgi:hypothetical protein
MGQIIVSLRFKSLLVDRPHPRANRELVSTVLSSSTSSQDYTTVVNEFVLLLIIGQQVLVWNWLTGKCHARVDTLTPGAITEACLLQRTAFMAFRQVENTPKLEVYTFSAQEPTSDEPPPILHAVYLLPRLQNNVEMAMQCRCNPPPFQYSHLVRPDISSIPIEPPCYFRRPFQIQETSRTIALSLNVRKEFGPEQTRDLVIIVPLQTFISADLDPEAPRGEPRVVPASEWMHGSQVLADIPMSDQWVYGTRFAILSPDLNLCICDFNPAKIAYLKHRQQGTRAEERSREPGGAQSGEDQDIIEWKEGSTDVGLVLGGPDFTDEMFFKEPLRCGKPFLMSISEEEIAVAPNEAIGVMVDDERVLLVRVGGLSSVRDEEHALLTTLNTSWTTRQS